MDENLLSLLEELSLRSGGSEDGPGEIGEQSHDNNVGYDKSKLLVALLGDTDIVTCAIKKINQLVDLGKKMEQIYRSYYRDPNVELDLNKISELIAAFSTIYNSESYVREVNITRVYQAYCDKLVDIYNYRMNFHRLM